MKFALLMKPPVLHAEPDCSPARATRCGGTGAAVWLCSAVWLGKNGARLQIDFLQSGSVFGCSLAVLALFCLFDLQSGSVVFAVWLFFVAVWLFLASQTARAEPDCKTTEPDCKSGSQTAKKKEPDCKKTAVRLFAVRLHNSSCREVNLDRGANFSNSTTKK